MNEKKNITTAEQNTDSICPKKQADMEMTDNELSQVSGGGAFDKVPTVPLNDYDEEIRGRS